MSDDRNPDKDYIFPQGIIRGLGLLPGGERKKWPDTSAPTKSTVKEPEGVGKEPEGVGKESEGAAKEPEGVGALMRPDVAMSPPPEHTSLSIVEGHKTNIQAAPTLVAAGAQIPPKFDPRGFWYTHGAMPSKAPQAGQGQWHQVGEYWIWCPTGVTAMPHHLKAVYQVGSPGAGWTQVFNNYWVAPNVLLAG